jgi:all-trans-retinol dehydrogenase (NAD+)
MVERNHGHVVTVSSICAYFTAPQMVDYSASKAAAQSFHEGLTLELRFRYCAEKVRTTLVSQGYVKTPMFTGFKSGPRFMIPALEPVTVAEAIVHKILDCEGGHLVMPTVCNAFVGIRAWTIWAQTMIWKEVRNAMKSFKGKQVM